MSHPAEPRSPAPASQASTSQASRRTFLQGSSALAAGGVLAATFGAPHVSHGAEDSDRILKVALIGAGGRGSGAAVNAMRADKGARLTVMCDMFEDRLASSRRALERQLGEQYAVEDAHCFTGFDGYKQVMETDVDVVCLCTSPHFRPLHLAAAVAAGKHVFCEKPVATDAPGVRSVLASTEEARKKGLNLVSGLCWRYDLGVRATIQQIKDGAIGEIVSLQENYLTGTLWHRGNNPNWTEMEYQMRNWLYFTWLSGDHNTEQHIHSLDKALWLMNDEPPAYCYGLGGRQVRTDEMWGNIYDHFAVVYEWANGVRCHAYTRQQAGCFNETEDYVYGTKGVAQILRHSVQPHGMAGWKYSGPKPSMYDVEHQELFAAIRAGEPINNGEYMSYSTMMAIMGRMACYTGQRLTWEQAINSQEDLSPKAYELGPNPVPGVAMPGKTKFS